MEISKKELLEVTGISYGQLYRWKREGLIPEEWFIKRSAFTGQETFFPKEKILPRIQTILEMKERYSLEELAKRLDNPPQQTSEKVSRDSPIPAKKLGEFGDFPPNMKLVLSELCPEGCNSERLLLLCGIAVLSRSLPLTLPDTKALVSAALQLPLLDDLTACTLRIWSGNRPA